MNPGYRALVGRFQLRSADWHLESPGWRRRAAGGLKPDCVQHAVFSREPHSVEKTTGLRSLVVSLMMMSKPKIIL